MACHATAWSALAGSRLPKRQKLPATCARKNSDSARQRERQRRQGPPPPSYANGCAARSSKGSYCRGLPWNVASASTMRAAAGVKCAAPPWPRHSRKRYCRPQQQPGRMPATDEVPRRVTTGPTSPPDSATRCNRLRRRSICRPRRRRRRCTSLRVLRLRRHAPPSPSRGEPSLDRPARRRVEAEWQVEAATVRARAVAEQRWRRWLDTARRHRGAPPPTVLAAMMERGGARPARARALRAPRRRSRRAPRTWRSSRR